MSHSNQEPAMPPERKTEREEEGREWERGLQ